MTVTNICRIGKGPQDVINELYEKGCDAGACLWKFEEDYNNFNSLVEDYGAYAVAHAMKWLTEIQAFTELNASREFRIGNNRPKTLPELVREELGGSMSATIMYAAWCGDNVYNAVDQLIERIAEANPDSEFVELEHRPLLH